MFGFFLSVQVEIVFFFYFALLQNLRLLGDLDLLDHLPDQTLQSSPDRQDHRDGRVNQV